MISNKIALEEHFAIEDTLGDSQQFMPGDFWTELKGRLLDKPEQRLRRMDEAGIELSLYSLNAPAIQALQDPGQALEIARRANDALAAEVARHPGRLAGLAALPMQDPEAAAAELRRCVTELGFRGALVNGFSDTPDGLGCLYYDLPRYDAFWREVAALDAPFYLHPREPLESQRMIYEGHPWLMGPVWAFGQETAVHALRLMMSGLFDRHPSLTIILGHLGEGLPFSLWRAEHRIRKFSRGCPALKPLGEYFRNNFYITTSGNCRAQALLTTLLEVGADRILFSTDYPFEEMLEPAQWFETLPISETDKLKIARTNAAKLFKLDRA